LLQNMAQQDFFTGIFPFLLSYVIFFLALQKAPLFDEENRKFSSVIAIIFSFFVSYFLVLNPVYQSFFASYLSRIVIGIVGILGLLVFLAFIPGLDLDQTGVNGFILLVVLATVSAFALSGGTGAFIPEAAIPGIEYSTSELVDAVFESGLIYLLIIGTALWWVTKDPESTKLKDKLNDGWVWAKKKPGDS